MDSKNKKIVIFDFDGVLADTEEFCYKIHKTTNKNLTWKKWQDFCDGNFIDGINNAVAGESHMIPEDFYERYQEEIEKINVNEVLDKTVIELSKSYIISIVSSSGSKIIDTFLTKEKLREYFSDILGFDIHSNKTIKINTLLKKYNILPENAVFITDSLGDILEANKCGVKSIGVTWGIHPQKTLEKGHPAVIIDDPRELINSINNVLK
jgi:phosphoglycolate phosphatase-like HAD superfamily hydrolase